MAGMELLKVDWPRFVNLSGNYFLALLRGQKVSEGKRFKDLFKEEKKKKTLLWSPVFEEFFKLLGCEFPPGC